MSNILAVRYLLVVYTVKVKLDDTSYITDDS